MVVVSGAEPFRKRNGFSGPGAHRGSADLEVVGAFCDVPGGMDDLADSRDGPRSIISYPPPLRGL